MERINCLLGATYFLFWICIPIFLRTVFIHFKYGCWYTIKTVAPLTMSLGSATKGSFEIGPYFNCAPVNVHIISHMGFDEGETPLLSEGS